MRNRFRWFLVLVLLAMLFAPAVVFSQQASTGTGDDADTLTQHSYLPMVQGGAAAAVEQAAETAATAAKYKPIVSDPVHYDTSPPLTELINMIATVHAVAQDATVRRRPLNRRTVPNGAVRAATVDPTVQATASAALPTTDLLNFEGVGNDDPASTSYFLSADPNLAVGETQVVQAVNAAFAIFNKGDGGLLLGPLDFNLLWRGFGGDCETHNNGDMIVQYDKAAQRWLLTQYSFDVTHNVYLQCVALSTTSDATGVYHRYAYQYPALNDYSKVGIWPNGYYVTYNMEDYSTPDVEIGARICVWDRVKMLAGRRAQEICFQLAPDVIGLLPSDLDGSRPPPADSPNFLVALHDDASLALWKFYSDFKHPAQAKLIGPLVVAVAPFNRACVDAIYNNCVPQRLTQQKLGVVSDYLMYRLAYRHFADGHEALVVNHTVDPGDGTAAVRWYEVRDPNGTPLVYQQGTYAPDATSRWMGSLAMDKLGNIALGYSAASSQINPAIRYTGRLVSDPVGRVRAEKSIIEGTGSQTQYYVLVIDNDLNVLDFENYGDVWVDYSAMSLDPVDDCTFWYTTEYLKQYGAPSWRTRIAAFKFAGCE